MSPRRGERWGGGGSSFDSDEDPTDFVDAPFGDTNPDAQVPPARAQVPPQRALVPPSKKRSLIVVEPKLPVAARLPTGMANERQLDAFRELRTRLLMMASGLGLEHFTTLIVPLSPGSGGSFVARNLAAAFTLEDGRMALLVDCNKRRPTQHQALSTRADDGGLFEFLDSPHQKVERLIRPTGIQGLHLIPAGKPSNQHREYFSSQAMRGVMSVLHDEPCHVFLDGPASEGAPDARILSEYANFVVLVVGYGRSTPDAISEAAALFDPAKFAGVVFNERE
jgi:protein-tyrosine kinase